MELEFDKEMDALLRQAATRGVLVGDKAGVHLDADAIAAFAENAVPQKRRAIYIQHLAECDPCRKTLSAFITLNEEAEPSLAAAVAPAAASVPWWRTLFATRNLAYTTGALVLVFGGLLGFIALQNSTTSDVSVSQVQEQPTAAPLEADSRAAESGNTTANANVSATPFGEIPRSVGVDEAQIASGDQPSAAGPPPPAASGTASNSAFAAKDQPLDRIAAGQPAPKPANERDVDKAEEKELGKLQTERKQDEDVNVARQQQQQNLQMTPGAGNTRERMPNRASVMREGRTATDDRLGAAKAKRAETESSRRVVAGKTFELKQGAWYDTAYTGQRTTNIRRGTDEYRKLDGGLRNIADTLRGTVVVVWRSKAYRIQ